MDALAIIVFILGYVVIAIEQPLKLKKAAPALFAGKICWTIYMFSGVKVKNVKA